jgi:hypothetical protein
MAKAGKKSTTSKVGQPATQPAARLTDGRLYVPEWKREEVRQEKEAAARAQKGPERRERWRAYIEPTDVGNPGEGLPELFERLWKQFQSGDNRSPLDLIVWSLSAMPPSEARTEFITRYNRWHSGKVRTLDQAFQVSRRKGEHVGHRRSDAELCRYIAPRIVELRREGRPVDRHLYETVGRELGIGRSSVERILKTPEYCTWRKLAEAGYLRLSPATKSEFS